MFKFAIIFTTLLLGSTVSAGLLSTHHIVHEPALAKVGHIVHSSPSAVSHQSITQVHGKTSVKTTVHAAPVVLKTIQPAVSVVKTVHTPTVHTYQAAPIVHTAPVVHSAPVLSVHHH